MKREAGEENGVNMLYLHIIGPPVGKQRNVPEAALCRIMNKRDHPRDTGSCLIHNLARFSSS